MRCSVPNCSNDTKGTSKSHGITFHKFPRDQSLRTAWVEALGMAGWKPKDRSTVCSDHFRNEDIYETKNGLRKIKNGAVPVVEQDSVDDLEAPAALRVCRICLAMDTQMYHIRKFKLNQMYEQITGLKSSSEERLPQRVCWECSARLSAAYRFRSQALRSDEILHELLHPDTYIKIRDIKSINNGLKSNQTQKMFDNSDDDSDNDLHLGEKTEIMQDNMEIQEDLEFMSKVEVKDESSNETFEEYDHFDDNEASSEVYEEKEEAEVEKEKKVVKKVNAKKIEEENDSDSATDRNKISDVNHLRMNEPLDESLYTISSLTHIQQIEEIQKRQESSSYRNAPYKCTVCYRGYKMKDLLTAHAVRHTEQRGAYECFICKSRMRSNSSLSKHLTAMHAAQYSCKKCQFVTRNRSVAKRHERWHAGTIHQCPHCERLFDNSSTYFSHIRLQHVSDFVCELCGYTFVSKKGVYCHKKIKHRVVDETITPEGPYCELCDVRFISEEAHDRHLKLSSRHVSENDPKHIRNNSQYINATGNGRVVKRRERRPVIHPQDSTDMNHGPQTPVNCEQCGKQLQDMYLYVQHFKRAHPDKNRSKYPTLKAPSMCEQCGKIFQCMALLRDHMWVHTGEKLHKCDRCNKSFTQKTNLMYHKRVHSATPPSYECPVCGKHFSFYRNMRRHVLIHTGLKPFKCDTCGKCFTTYGEHRAHVEHVHLKKPWPKRVRQRSRKWKCEESSAED